MGSMADGQRQNVALTGAREGLIIVRHAEIGKYSSVAAQSWVKLVSTIMARATWFRYLQANVPIVGLVSGRQVNTIWMAKRIWA